MDRNLANRLKRDKEFEKKITTLVSQYAKTGLDSVAYWMNEFDAAHDLLMAYSALSKKDFEQLEKNHPRRFVLPMTATQLYTMTTFITQMLFGQETPHKVVARGAEDEEPAEYMNQLLKWNAEQQPTYLLGFLWVLDAVTYNRAVYYNSWREVTKVQMVTEDVVDEFTDPDPETGEPVTYARPKRERQVIGGFNRYDLVSVYDFFCDPQLPLWRLQDMRFCGHRFKVTWEELKRRSKLPVDHPAYVRPEAVAQIKDKRRAMTVASAPPLQDSGGTAAARPDAMMSRTYFERLRQNGPMTSEMADAKDPGNIECLELWAKLVPKDYGLGSSEDPAVFQFVVASGDTVLSVTESTYEHEMYPYNVAEGRPSGYYQYSPSWTFILKGLQDHIDWLKNKHQEALGRTIGNVFIADPTKVDLDDFLDPDKEGMIIPLKPEASGSIRDIIQQVPIKDLTERFHEEMIQFVDYADTVTGANASMQGDMSADPNSATQFAGTQQMSAGRLASIARILSVMGLVPQTKQLVSNFQQFLEVPQVLRYQPDRLDIPAAMRQLTSITVDSDAIQGNFDFIAHDGTLPGPDTKMVAAITRLLETAAAFPQVFMPQEGNLDPRKLIFAAAKRSGMNVENFQYTPDALQQMANATATASTGLVVPPGGQAQGAPPSVIPPGGPPGPAPAEPTLQPPGQGMSFPDAAPPDVRPANV
jgi:hypothetical protein